MVLAGREQVIVAGRKPHHQGNIGDFLAIWILQMVFRRAVYLVPDTDTNPAGCIRFSDFSHNISRKVLRRNALWSPLMEQSRHLFSGDCSLALRTRAA